MNEETGDVVQEAFDKALEKVHPKVAEAVREKFADDQRSFLAAAKEAEPHKSVYDWASSDCKHCYGRGYTGWRVNPITHKAIEEAKVVCRCTSKNYKKWLKSFRVEYNLKRDSGGQDGAQETTTSQSADNQEAV